MNRPHNKTRSKRKIIAISRTNKFSHNRICLWCTSKKKINKYIKDWDKNVVLTAVKKSPPRDNWKKALGALITNAWSCLFW